MYLVIGGSGFLGRYVIENILEQTEEDVFATYTFHEPPKKNDRVQWVKLDVCDVGALIKLNSQLESQTKIIYLASYHNPDRVEENPSLAWNINIVALANAINILNKASCFYYSSTDIVYGEGSKNWAFDEQSPLNPVNLYGKHKVLAEQIVLTHGGNVVRFPFMIGTSLVESKKHFFDFIKADLEQGKVIEMFEDSYRSTLDFNQCAKLLVMLIEKCGACYEKILNIAGDDVLSKYDVALLLAEKYGFNEKFIKAISIKQNNSIFTAKRANSAALNNTKIKNILNLKKIKLEL